MTLLFFLHKNEKKNYILYTNKKITSYVEQSLAPVEEKVLRCFKLLKCRNFVISFAIYDVPISYIEKNAAFKG